MKWVLGVLAAVVVGFAGWVRLAPTDAGRWHVVAGVSGTGHAPMMGGHVWRGAIPGEADAGMATLDRIIRDTPRTRVIAGNLGEGRVTYETRSKLWGFPDYTTLSLVPASDATGGAPIVEIYSRLRFGTSDMGVNRDRILRWLKAAGQG